MKKIIIAVVALAVVLTVLLSAVSKKQESELREQYIRIHIRANSNEEADQKVKLKVRDAVITFLTPVLSYAETKEEAAKVLQGCLGEIERVADVVLTAQNMGYRASAKLKTEKFPEREYNDLTLPAGVYDALIINLGSGDGDNWWCVAFPPLCFVPKEGSAVEYRSKILEIIEEWKEKNGKNND